MSGKTVNKPLAGATKSVDASQAERNEILKKDKRFQEILKRWMKNNGSDNLTEESLSSYKKEHEQKLIDLINSAKKPGVSPAVEAHQIQMKRLGYDIGSSTDGKKGQNTVLGIMEFQIDKGISPTGELTAEMWTELENIMRPRNPKLLKVSLSDIDNAFRKSTKNIATLQEWSEGKKDSKDIKDRVKIKEYTKTLQDGLMSKGYDLSSEKYGEYTEKTIKALIHFQSISKLGTDGQVGPTTLSNLTGQSEAEIVSWVQEKVDALDKSQKETKKAAKKAEILKTADDKYLPAYDKEIVDKEKAKSYIVKMTVAQRLLIADRLEHSGYPVHPEDARQGNKIFLGAIASFQMEKMKDPTPDAMPGTGTRWKLGIRSSEWNANKGTSYQDHRIRAQVERNDVSADYLQSDEYIESIEQTRAYREYTKEFVDIAQQIINPNKIFAGGVLEAPATILAKALLDGSGSAKARLKNLDKKYAKMGIKQSSKDTMIQMLKEIQGLQKMMDGKRSIKEMASAQKNADSAENLVSQADARSFSDFKTFLGRDVFTSLTATLLAGPSVVVTNVRTPIIAERYRAWSTNQVTRSVFGERYTDKLDKQLATATKMRKSALTALKSVAGTSVLRYPEKFDDARNDTEKVRALRLKHVLGMTKQLAAMGVEIKKTGTDYTVDATAAYKRLYGLGERVVSRIIGGDARMARILKKDAVNTNIPLIDRIDAIVDLLANFETQMQEKQSDIREDALEDMRDHKRFGLLRNAFRAPENYHNSKTAAKVVLAACGADTKGIWEKRGDKMVPFLYNAQAKVFTRADVTADGKPVSGIFHLKKGDIFRKMTSGEFKDFDAYHNPKEVAEFTRFKATAQIYKSQLSTKRVLSTAKYALEVGNDYETAATRLLMPYGRTKNLLNVYAADPAIQKTLTTYYAGRRGNPPVEGGSVAMLREAMSSTKQVTSYFPEDGGKKISAGLALRKYLKLLGDMKAGKSKSYNAYVRNVHESEFDLLGGGLEVNKDKDHMYGGNLLKMYGGEAMTNSQLVDYLTRAETKDKMHVATRILSRFHDITGMNMTPAELLSGAARAQRGSAYGLNTGHIEGSKGKMAGLDNLWILPPITRSFTYNGVTYQAGARIAIKPNCSNLVILGANGSPVAEVAIDPQNSINRYHYFPIVLGIPKGKNGISRTTDQTGTTQTSGIETAPIKPTVADAAGVAENIVINNPNTGVSMGGQDIPAYLAAFVL